MFDRLGTIVSRHWVLVLLAWVLLAVGIDRLAPRWDEVTHDGDFAYLPSDMISVKGRRLLKQAFPDIRSQSTVVLVLSRAEGRLQSADFEVAERLIKEFTPAAGEASPIVSVRSHESPVLGKKLISRPGTRGQALLIALLLRNEFMAVENMELMTRVLAVLDTTKEEASFPEGLELGVTGSAAVGSDMFLAARESIRNTETTTIVMVISILLLVYRAPGLVLVPLVTIGVSVAVAMDLVALLAEYGIRFQWFDFKVFKTTKIFIVVILFGAGTDYCLFLIARYREELRQATAPDQALVAALGKVGGALAASALTTVFGLGMMFFADFGKFHNSGPAIGLCLMVALAACVTLTPALLRGVGPTVFWPFRPRPTVLSTISTSTLHVATCSDRFWQWLGMVVTRRPGLILGVAVLVLAPAAYEGLSVPITYDLLNELPADSPSVRGTRLLKRHFATAEIDPLIILAYDAQGRFLLREGERKIASLTRELYRLEYTDSDGKKTRPILAVRSLTEPLGNPPGSFNPLLGSVRDKIMVLRHRRTKALYVSHSPEYVGKVTRLDLVFQYDPRASESVRLLDHVEQRLRPYRKTPSHPGIKRSSSSLERRPGFAISRP